MLICWLTDYWVDHLDGLKVGQGDLARLSEPVLGLDSCRRFKLWWLRFDVIEDLLDYCRVGDVGNDTRKTEKIVGRNPLINYLCLGG